MKRIAETIESVPIPAIGPDWHRRVILGCWSARYLPLRAQYLPRYSMTLICFDLGYARQFLQIPRVFFTVNQLVLMGPLGRGFLEEARAANRRVYLWTVNSPSMMRWAIRHEVDGVITDEPAQFKQLCEGWGKEQRDETAPDLDQLTVGERLRILLVVVYLLLFGWFLKFKYLPSVERVQFEQRKVG
jgi:phosphatidylglycerol phospholipase C